MLSVNALIILGAVLVLFAILSSRLSTRAGVPALVVWIALGMLAGSEGVGGIAFENYRLASGIGTVALALILFDGGLRTSTASLKAAWKPALALSTVGVVITAAVTGVAATLLFGMPILQGILLGSIVGSTDAAAVFALLRGRGVRLPSRLNATLEVESGSNDPMAVMLTIGTIEILLGRMDPGLGLARFLVFQMGVGLAVGLIVGFLGVWLNNRINLEAGGLYPVMNGAVGLLAYGLSAAVGGSGFLSVYVAGIVLGSRPMVFKRGILLFMDGTAWLGQIVMFTVLGLLSFPSRLLSVAPAGLAITAVLIFLARPLAVVPLLLPFRFSAREIAVIVWGGLKGAVPIILATFPLLSGIPEGRLLFDIVFFVVLVSAVTQGWTLPWLAKRLGLQRRADEGAALSLEITALRQVSGDIVDYAVVEESKASHRRIRDLALPDGAVIAMVARGREMIPPRGSTVLEPGDHAFVVVRPEVRSLVERAFALTEDASGDLAPGLEFHLSGRVRIDQLEEFYGIHVEAPPQATLDELLRSRLGPSEIQVGASIELGEIVLTIREVSSGGIERVGLEVNV